MNGPRDDLLDALHYQVKEEVINNYLRERLILEEEVKEYTEGLGKYRIIEAEVREIRDNWPACWSPRKISNSSFPCWVFPARLWIGWARPTSKAGPRPAR